MAKCSFCDTEYKPAASNQNFCSKKCREANESFMRRNRYTAAGQAAWTRRWTEMELRRIEREFKKAEATR